MRSSRDDTAQVGDRQQSFSAVYETPGPHNELPHIKRVLDASDAGGNFCVPAVEDLIADLGRVVWHQEEPFQSTSIFAQWCVMRLVRERGITVLLDGQGADEALGGYRPYSHHLAALTARLRLGRALREAGAIDEVAGVSPLPFVARSVALHLPRPAASYLRARKRRARQAGVLNGEFAHQFPTDGSVPVGCGGRDALDNELRLTLEETSLPHLLRHEDRNSMAFSVEARMPFIDFRLVEFSFREALDWKIYQGWTKWILRAAMEDTVPREIIWRRDKVGFETPEAEWTDALVQRRDEYFGPEALSAPYLDLPALRRQLALPRGQRPDDRMIWRSINLEAWLRTWCSRAT
jgi:asparagine synthase (glutamine-hydrolysing)